MEGMNLKSEQNIRPEFLGKLVEASELIENGSAVVEIDGSDVLITTDQEEVSDRIGGTFLGKNNQKFFYCIF